MATKSPPTPPPKKKLPASGYPHEQPEPGSPKLPGRGRPDEPQNAPDQKPGRPRTDD